MSSHQEAIEVSVIIPSGRPDQVGKTIEALKDQDFSSKKYEILIVSPSPAVFDHKQSPQIKFVRTDRLYPPGKMRNLGTEVARGAYLAFIDDDCIPPPLWLSTLLRILKASIDAAAVGCRVTALKNNYWGRAADYSLFSAYQYYQVKEISLGSAATLIRRDCYLEVGGFDEFLTASEDWDISLKFQSKGRICLFDPKVEVQHDHGCYSFSSILKKAYLYGYRSRLDVQRRHLEQMSWLARLSLKMKSPWLYWLLVVPYALLVSTLQATDFIGYDRKYILYFPVVLLSRVLYHTGVLIGLARNGAKDSFV